MVCPLAKLLEHVENMDCYGGFDSLEVSSRYCVGETRYLEEVPVPRNIQIYIDYQFFGRDMEISDNYIVISHGVLNTFLKIFL